MWPCYTRAEALAYYTAFTVSQGCHDSSSPSTRMWMMIGLRPGCPFAPLSWSPFGPRPQDRGADRYSFIHTRFAGLRRAPLGSEPRGRRQSSRGGGNAANRSSERHMREIAYLRRKWGPYLSVVQAKGTTRLVVRVRR